MFAVEVFRDGQWTIIGQYHTKEQASLIADDYYANGDRSRVVGMSQSLADELDVTADKLSDC